MAGKLRKKSDEHFIKTFDLTKFRAFHPSYKFCLTGTERGLFDYILFKKLSYTGKGHLYGGNTIKVDKQFKKTLLKEYNVSTKTYESMITKLINDGILNRISNGYFQVNPYAFAKGEDLAFLRELGIYRDSTLALQDKKCICTIVPTEEPWVQEETAIDEEEPAPPEPEKQVPVMPVIKGRNATLNNCFKK